MRSQAVARILDANLDRAREGLRVLEDWFRFGFESATWATTCKEMRQSLVQWHSDTLRLARDTSSDLGADTTYPDVMHRSSHQQLLKANCSRVQEALRVLEEYAKLAEVDQLVPPGMAPGCKQLRYQMYELETFLLNSDRHHRLHQAHLYLVTSPGPNWLKAVEQALKGGVSLVQYRHKTATDAEMLQDLKQLKALCQDHQALMLVNDRVDLALLAQADGVHLGQTDIPVDQARLLLGPHQLIGQSTTNPQELAAALKTSANYVGVGPVYATPTKAGKAPAGFDYVRHAQQIVPIPWFAIGGIDASNLSDVMAAGASRVAVVRSLMDTPDPCQTAQAMIAQLTSNNWESDPNAVR